MKDLLALHELFTTMNAEAARPAPAAPVKVRAVKKKEKAAPPIDGGEVLHSFEKWSWWLSFLAGAYARAERLEKDRAAFHTELYAAIRYPTVHYDKEYTGNLGSPATDVQAIRIIEAKERYERKIKQEYKRNTTWMKILLNWATEKEKFIMIQYFQKSKHVDRSILLSLVSRLDRDLMNLERRNTRERNEIAMNDFEKYQEQTKTFRKSRDPD